MTRFFLPVVLGLSLLAGGCTQAQVQTATNTASAVCTDVQAAESNAAVAGPLDAEDPHSALGVLWADAKSACTNGVPAVGVSTDWGALVWSEAKQLVPVVLPILIGLV
ncbi:MAG TPA: hypothetical protein VHY35_13740 [Stellaceae bacterium]|jgi:hypothetical protein|nr:hypothetical protein [Stellaceae bacterium]